MKRLGDLLSSRGPTDSPLGRVIDATELKVRIRHCGRLFAAWPNARPASIDLTLLEYVNATRGVPVDQLQSFIDSVILAGGEFLPPAGAIVERIVKSSITAAGQGYNKHISGEQRAREAQERIMVSARSEARCVEPVLLEEVQRAVALEAGPAMRRIGAGR